MFRIAGRVLLIGFLLWHMFAVAVYSVPRDAKDAIATWTRLDLLPAVTPYMFTTSQWQLWNIFSPDPLRRVTTYRIEMKTADGWTPVETVGPDSFSIFRHAVRMKLMGNMLDEFKDNRSHIAGRYMHLLCAEHSLQSGSEIRLVYDVYVLPFLEKPQSAQWWRDWQPERQSTIGFLTTCP